MLSKEDAEKIKQQLLAQLSKLPEAQVKNLRDQITSMNPAELERFISRSRAASQQTTGATGAAAGEVKEGECLFCQIAQGKIETIKIYEDNNVLAILDIAPANPGQVFLMFP